MSSIATQVLAHLKQSHTTYTSHHDHAARVLSLDAASFGTVLAAIKHGLRSIGKDVSMHRCTPPAAHFLNMKLQRYVSPLAMPQFCLRLDRSGFLISRTALSASATKHWRRLRLLVVLLLCKAAPFLQQRVTCVFFVVVDDEPLTQLLQLLSLCSQISFR